MGILRKFVTLSALITVSVVLAGCSANHYTVARTSQISLDDGNKGGAVHLDAQQRVVVYTAKGFCAEPSPDALSAYTASFGLGATTPNEDSVSLAKALQSMTGSLGLRTQSITLMRDALYRVCEAANNNELAPWEVAAFLRRSLNLTAVILAIEQLTGAVAANQLVLTPSARADASASLLANQQFLDEAEERVNVAQGRVTAAEERFENLQSEAEEATGVEIQRAPNSALKTAEDELTFARQRLRDALEVRDRIKLFRDTALTEVQSETFTSALIPAPTQARSLSPEATRAIAAAVEGMVEEVLTKSYSAELCLSYLTAVSHRFDSEKAVPGVVDYVNTTSLCRDVIAMAARQEAHSDPKAEQQKPSGAAEEESIQLIMPFRPKEP